MSRRPMSLNPFELIARKQRLGEEDANTMVLPVLLYLDAAKRGRADITASNGLAQWIAMAQIIASKIVHRPMYDIACGAGQALYRAAGRREALLSLTTGEYIALRKLMAVYLRVLPQLELQMMVAACARADQLVAQLIDDAA